MGSVLSGFLVLRTTEIFIIRGIFPKLLYFHWVQVNFVNRIIRDFKQILDKTNKQKVQCVLEMYLGSHVMMEGLWFHLCLAAVYPLTNLLTG